MKGKPTETSKRFDQSLINGQKDKDTYLDFPIFISWIQKLFVYWIICYCVQIGIFVFFPAGKDFVNEGCNLAFAVITKKQQNNTMMMFLEFSYSH